jgi:tetratricopeptide (TPR) repeat protein
VFTPGKGYLHMANGTSPVSQNTYVKFPTIDKFDPETFSDYRPDTIDNSSFRQEHPEQARAEQLYIRARAAYEYDNDAERALDFLRQAVQADGENPAYHLVRALMAVRAGKLDEAGEAADGVLAFDFDSPRQAVALFLKGRIAADRGDRAEALELLQRAQVHRGSSGHLIEAAGKAARKVEKRGRLRFAPYDIAPMMILPDAYGYESALPW